MADRSDRLKTVWLAVNVGLLTLAFILAKTGRDALFFQGRGVFQLPQAYMAIGLCSLPAAMLFVLVMRRIGSRAARLAGLALTGLALAAFVPFLQPMSYNVLLAFFILVPTLFGILFASLWLLASDLFEGTPKASAARAFSQIGASSLAGGMVGGLLSKGITALSMDPKWLVLAAALAVFASLGVTLKTHKAFRAGDGNPENKKAAATFQGSFSKKYARALLLISLTTALAGMFIDFQFYASASMARMGSQGNANFFANFYIMLSFCSLLLQLFAAPKIQDRIGILGGLVVLPLALLGGATFVTVAATALSQSVLKVTEGGLKASIHRSIWEQAFIPVDSSERPLVKLVVDGIGARVGESVGATAILIWLTKLRLPDNMPGNLMPMLNTAWLAWATLLTVIVWIVLTRSLRAELSDDRTGARTPAARGGQEPDCVRFPEQCPCTTELGKGVR